MVIIFHNPSMTGRVTLTIHYDRLLAFGTWLFQGKILGHFGSNQNHYCFYLGHSPTLMKFFEKHPSQLGSTPVCTQNHRRCGLYCPPLSLQVKSIAHFKATALKCFTKHRLKKNNVNRADSKNYAYIPKQNT